MSILQSMKIRHKLTAIIMLTCVISLVLVGAVFIAVEYTSSRKTLIGSLSTQAEMIADNCKASVIFDDPQDARDTLKSLRLEPSIIRACIYTKDGDSFAVYQRDDAGEKIYFKDPLRDGYSFSDGILGVSKSIIVDGESVGFVCLRSDLHQLNTALTHNLYTVVFVLFGVSFIAYVLSARLQRVISGPILALTEVARNVSDNKEYSVRAVKDSNDEVGLLIDSFNEMLTQIEGNKMQLTEVNESLEEKVNERTQELSKEIAERRQAEERLKIFYRFAEESSQGVGWADLEGNVIFINPALSRMFGEERPENAYGKPVARYYDRHTQKRLAEEIFPKVIKDGQWLGELSTLGKNGEKVPTMNNLFLMRDIDGEPLYIANTLIDITERRQTEQQREEYMAELMIARDYAEEANLAKSQFLANMSHEIRTPMNGIIGFSDLLADEQLTEDQKGYVGIIRTSGDNLLRLIDDILDFSKIEAGQLDTEIIDCSLAEMLNSVGSLMRPRAMEKGLQFEIIEKNGLPANIKTDPTRLRQCLINLISNAVKFTETGHVFVTVSLDEFNNEPFIRFDVEDTGIGIPVDKHRAIFESFSQADGSTTRKYGGTGLGLTITKQLAGLLGGELTLISEEGEGSTFSIAIPAGLDITKQPFLDRHNIEGNTVLLGQSKARPQFSGRVLIAEDAPTNQVLIKSLLKQFGLDVTLVEDGLQAIEQVETCQFDLIFMDMMMPVMNGYEAAESLRKQSITVPIIALTANAIKGDDKKCLDAGCDEYLSKPIDQAGLLAVIAKYLPVKELASVDSTGSGKA